jgi:hypothetical protein
MRLASALGSDAMIARCQVHIVYCNIQLGKFGTAIRQLRTVRRFAAVTEDAGLMSMVESGTRYCRNTYRLYATGVLAFDSFLHETHPTDEYYRQRIARLTL